MAELQTNHRFYNDLHVGGGAVPRHVERQRVVAWRGAALRRLAEAGAAVGEPDLTRH